MLAHYRIIEKLGAGGMGEVYRAHDTRLDRDVAVKVLPDEALADPVARRRLLREARAAAALNHPHVCTIHEVGEATGRVYIAMELIAGLRLDEVIRQGGMPAHDVLRYGLQIAEAVAHAHERGVIHRDLKTGNTLVTPQGRIKVLDFGLAIRPIGEDVSDATTAWQGAANSESFAGTLPFMAPEQVRGEEADARTDVWALGVMLYEMATGVRPFPARTPAQLISAIVHDPPAPLPESVPFPLRAVIERCLEKSPERRYQRASEVHAALDAIRSGETFHVAERGRRQRRSRWLAPAAALVIAGVLAGAWWMTRTLAPPRLESLAVLPFDNLSRDPGQEYFVDGMTDAIITDLARLGGLKVISRTSAMRYKGTDKPLADIARELGVKAVVEGSVLRVGNRVRITAQLIEGMTDTHLWADSYERELEDVLFLQRELAHAIAKEIRGSLAAEGTRSAQATRTNSAAYDAYLLGRHYANQRSSSGLARAVSLLERAIEQDPGFAPAYAALADAYLLMEVYAASPPMAAYEKAKALSSKALQIDPTLGEAHVSLAWIAFTLEFDWAAAEANFEHAIRLSPGYVTAHHWYAVYLCAMGRIERAKAGFARALELDPFAPIVFTQTGFPYLSARDYPAALERYRMAAERFPGFRMAQTSIARTLVAAGAYEEAIAAIPSAEPQLNEGLLGMAYGLLGRTRDARAVLQELQMRSRTAYVPARDYVYVYTGLGDRPRALDWLERGYDERGIFAAWLKTWPLYDPLRAEPRFTALMTRMKFPD